MSARQNAARIAATAVATLAVFGAGITAAHATGVEPTRAPAVSPDDLPDLSKAPINDPSQLMRDVVEESELAAGYLLEELALDDQQDGQDGQDDTVTGRAPGGKN